MGPQEAGGQTPAAIIMPNRAVRFGSMGTGLPVDLVMSSPLRARRAAQVDQASGGREIMHLPGRQHPNYRRRSVRIQSGAVG